MSKNGRCWVWIHRIIDWGSKRILFPSRTCGMVPTRANLRRPDSLTRSLAESSFTVKSKKPIIQRSLHRYLMSARMIVATMLMSRQVARGRKIWNRPVLMLMSPGSRNREPGNRSRNRKRIVMIVRIRIVAFILSALPSVACSVLCPDRKLIEPLLSRLER